MTQLRFSYLAIAFILAVFATQAQAQAPQEHPVEVVTLYTPGRQAPAPIPSVDKPAEAPIVIVNNGVKPDGPSCFDLDNSGRITTAPGDCVVLRSAKVGEAPPAPQDR